MGASATLGTPGPHMGSGGCCRSGGLGLLWENRRRNSALAKPSLQHRQEAGAGGELTAEVRVVMETVHHLPSLAGRALSGVTGPAVTRSFRTGCSCHRAGFA